MTIWVSHMKSIAHALVQQMGEYNMLDLFHPDAIRAISQKPGSK